MEFIRFVFSSFWNFLGFVVLVSLAITALKTFFNFVVELIHGKPTVVNLPPGAKVEEKEQKKDSGNKVKGKVSISGGDVSVRSNS